MHFLFQSLVPLNNFSLFYLPVTFITLIKVVALSNLQRTAQIKLALLYIIQNMLSDAT